MSSMTQEIQFAVRNPSGFNVSLAAPLTTIVSDLIKTLQNEETAEFPRTDKNGKPVGFSLNNPRTGTILDSTKSLAAQDVRNGDTLEASFNWGSAH